MAIRFFPFGAGAGSTVDETEWAAMAKWFRETGVIPDYLNDFEVYGDASGMQVKVKTGAAIIDGVYVDTDAETTLTVTAADVTNPRIDRVILQVDWTNNTVTLEMLDGTPAASPSPTGLTTSSSIWEISLAQVYVGAGVSTINSANVTDEREFSASPNFGLFAGSRTAKTISSGAITVQGEQGLGFITLTGEGATTDTLSTINSTNVREGSILILRGPSGYDITVDDAGNIKLGETLSRVVLRDNNPIFLVYDAGVSKWQMLGAEYAGKRSFYLPAMAFYPADQVNTLASLVNSIHPALSFVDGASDYAYVNLEMPDDYDGGDIVVSAWWISGIANTLAVRFEVAVDQLADGEAYASYTASGNLDDNAQGSTTEVLRTPDVTLTAGTNWAAGKLTVFRFGRLGADAADTLGGIAYFLGLKVEYTVDKANQN